MTRRTPTHLRQLVVAVAAALGASVLLLRAAEGVDGPHRPGWAPVFGAVITLWVFAVAWLAGAVVLTLCATIREARAPQRRPRPGTGRRPHSGPGPAPARIRAPAGGASAARPETVYGPGLPHRVADRWAADGPRDVPPVDPDAQYKPRGLTYTEARPARDWLEPRPDAPESAAS